MNLTFAKLFFIGVTCLGMLASSAAFAGSGSGTIGTTAIGTETFVGHLYFVYLNKGDANISGTPGCATQTTGAGGNRYVFDVSTPSGKAMLSTILLSKALGTSISIGGSGNCGLWGDTESINIIYAN